MDDIINASTSPFAQIIRTKLFGRLKRSLSSLVFNKLIVVPITPNDVNVSTWYIQRCHPSVEVTFLLFPTPMNLQSMFHNSTQNVPLQIEFAVSTVEVIKEFKMTFN